MKTAFVKIWGELAGAVAWDSEQGMGVFEFDPNFKKLGWDLSPLQMPISRPQNLYRFPGLRLGRDGTLNTFKGLPGLLADSLPDRYGSELIQQWLARQGRTPESLNPVELLCFIGSRGMGALEFEPASQAETQRTFQVEVEELVEIAKSLLNRKKSFTTNWNSGEEKAVRDILRIGTSAGGARPKAVIAWNEKKGEIRSGQTLAPKGFEHWLLKLDGVSAIQLGETKGYGRVEMAYHLMALECGIHMMPCRLLEENGRAHFMTKRFDREGGNVRHHVQTFCALKHFDYNANTSFSYEQLFQTMRELRLPYPDAEQMYRRMVFNVLARNCDDHTKNFSFILKQGGAWELAPAYDVCYAYEPGHRWVSRHALSIQGKREDFRRKDLLAIGESIKTRKINPAEIIDQIEWVVSQWKRFADQTKVAPRLRNTILKNLVRLR